MNNTPHTHTHTHTHTYTNPVVTIQRVQRFEQRITNVCTIPAFQFLFAPEGSGEQGKMKETGCEIICRDPYNPRS